jgi:leucyl aminopeptidase
MIPTRTDVQISAASKLPAGGGVFLLADDRQKLLGDTQALPGPVRDAAAQMLKDGTLAGKPGEVGVDMVGGRRVIVIGVGRGDTDRIRDAGAIAAKQARRFKQADASIICPPGAPAAEALAAGYALGAFEYREYRGAAAKQKEAEALKRLRLTIVGGDKHAVARGEAVAFGQNYARTIASRPGNDINPPSLAKEAQRLAKEMGLNIRIIDDAEARRMGMGGLIGVGQGSGKPPRMIALEYGMVKRRSDDATKRRRGRKGGSARGKPPLLVVGKAITFDTGGISIKPAQGMGSMIYDKCGGMAVLGLMAAAARLKLDRSVVGILAAAENMPGPDAYRPGDILKMYNGVTVEVTNTDAEGRLVLADALAWGIETYAPAACVNLATLTGACVVALGTTRAGAWSNNDGLWQALSSAAERAGEKLWRMPLGDDYRDMLKATAADILNSPGRNGGSNTAAEFLHHFIPGNLDGKAEVPWCHLDIAGVADTEKDTPLYTKGATGFGVRTLVEWVTGS